MCVLVCSCVKQKVQSSVYIMYTVLSCVEQAAQMYFSNIHEAHTSLPAHKDILIYLWKNYTKLLQQNSLVS